MHGGGGPIDPRFRDPFYGLVPHEDSPPIYESGSNDPASFGPHDPFRELEPPAATHRAAAPESSAATPKPHLSNAGAPRAPFTAAESALPPREGAAETNPLPGGAAPPAPPAYAPREWGDLRPEDLNHEIELPKNQRGILDQITPTYAVYRRPGSSQRYGIPRDQVRALTPLETPSPQQSPASSGRTLPAAVVHPYGGVTEEHIGQEIETPQGHRGILEKLTPRKAFFRGTDDGTPYSMSRDRVRLAGPIPSPRKFGDLNHDDIGDVAETRDGRRGSLMKLTPTAATLQLRGEKPFGIPPTEVRITPTQKLPGLCPFRPERGSPSGSAEEEVPEDKNAPLPAGWFRITEWTGYPKEIPRHTDPIRISAKDEYKSPRQTANQRNAKLHRENPSLEGFQIHEILPIKFGGSPTDVGNKMLLSPQAHDQVTQWWTALQNKMHRLSP